MNIDFVDLNLFRLFDAVYRNRSVSRAAEELGLSQPAASQGLMRLRERLRDPLFERVSGGVQPTDRARRLASSVQAGLALLEAGLAEGKRFDPLASSAELRIHLSDIGEARFLPGMMAAFRECAPNLRIQTRAYADEALALELDSGHLHFAIGYLPSVDGTARAELLTDRYQVFMRADHPARVRVVNGTLDANTLAQLDFIAVRSHAETLRILQMLHLEPRIRLVTANFLALPSVVRSTDLVVLMPRAIARTLEPVEAFDLVEAGLPQQDFSVALHWSRRHQHDAMLSWVRTKLLELFGQQ